MKKFLVIIILGVLIYFGIKFFLSSDDDSSRESTNIETTLDSSCVEDATKCVYRNLSKEAMNEELLEMGYSQSDINAALKKVPLNFKYAAKVRAEKILEKGNFTEKEVYNSLRNDYLFTKDEANYAIKNAKGLGGSTEAEPKKEAKAVVKKEVETKAKEVVEEPKPEVKQETKKEAPKKEVKENKTTKRPTRISLFEDDEKKEAPVVDPKVKSLAADILRKTGDSKLMIGITLEQDYKYAREETLQAMEELDVDWYDVALKKAIKLSKEGVKKNDLYEVLYSEEGFTREEAKYAAAKVDDYL